MQQTLGSFRRPLTSPTIIIFFVEIFRNKKS
jgi:hypothetical protein